MIRSALSYGIAETSAKGLQWVLLASLPLIVSPAEYGRIGLLVAIEGIAVTLLLLGQDRAVLRFYDPEVETFLSTVIVLCFSISVPIVAASLIGIDMLGGEIFSVPVMPQMVVFALAILLIMLNRFYLAAFRVEGDLASYTRFRLGFALLRVLVIAIFLRFMSGSDSYVFATFLAIFAILVVGSGEIRARTRRAFDVSVARRAWRFGWPIAFHAAGGGILVFIDRFFLEHYLTVAAVGVYTLAYTIGSAVTFIYAAMSIYFEPKIYQQAGDLARSEQWLGQYSLFVIAMASVTALIVLILLPFVSERLLDAEYAPIRSVTPVILAAHLLHPIYLQSNYRLGLHEETRLLAIGTILAATVNVVANLVFIPPFGMMGAAGATFLSYLVLSLVSYWASLRYGGVPFSAVQFRLVLLLSLFSVIVLATTGSGPTAYLALSVVAIYASWSAIRCATTLRAPENGLRE